jgi:2-methylcitrate dehydratase PrpD
LEGGPNILEGGPVGFAMLMTGGEFDLDKMSQGLGSSFDIISPGGLCLKFWSSCYQTQRCIEAILHLINEHRIKANEVAEVICQFPNILALSLPYSRPKTGVEGWLSMEYCMAAILLDGELGARAFTDDKVRRPEAQELITRVKCIPTGGTMTMPEALRQSHTVTIRLKNGKEYSHKVNFPRGDIRNPMTDKEITAKFQECASLTFTPEQIRRVLELGWNLESIPLLSNLTDLLIGDEGKAK